MHAIPEHAEAEWPAEDLECLDGCPLCGSPARALLLDGLTDSCFGVAPGRWTLWRCTDCRLGYLDPRPSRDSIGRAYASYYTHDIPIPPTKGWIARRRAALANGYRNRRFGTSVTPANRMGPAILAILPRYRRSIDWSFRFLPLPLAGTIPAVLDIGCGNGAWLRKAGAAGWDAIGVEPDPIARKRAAETGLVVFDTLNAVEATGRRFDWVTLSHVIEHLHNPVTTLVSARRLMQPKATLFIETPNLGALGFERYGRNWRGLETPRHLVLFDHSSIAIALAKAGFDHPAFHPFREVWRGMSASSEQIAIGQLPSDWGGSWSRLSWGERARAMLSTRNTEFLTLTARPGSDS